jgi:GH35 family endo-1,4-beta-xylanase
MLSVNLEKCEITLIEKFLSTLSQSINVRVKSLIVFKSLADSWLNGWPVPGRTNYSLLIDRQYNVKPVVKDIIKLFK